MIKRSLLSIFLLLIFVSPSWAVLTYTGPTLIRDSGGADANKIVIMMVASGYDSTEQAAASTAVGVMNTNLFVSSGGSPDGNAFYTNASSFNVYRVLVESPTSGTALTTGEITAVVQAIHDAGGAGSLPDYILVYHKAAIGGVQTYSTITITGHGDIVSYEFGTDDVGSTYPYQINHEMAHIMDSAVHTLVSIADEYYDTGTCVGSTRYKFNIHDRYTATPEKWSNVLATAPVEGGMYCPPRKETGQGIYVYRPTASSWMRSPTTNTGFGAVVNKAVDLAIKKNSKIGTVTTTFTTPTVSGLTAAANHSDRVRVNLTVDEEIERVEWYIQKYNAALSFPDNSMGAYHPYAKKVQILVKNAAGDSLLSSADLDVGSTATNISHGAFSYQIGGVTYNKTANAVGVAPGNDVIPYFTYGAIALDIGTDGTVDATEATNNATGYTSCSTAIAGIPVPASNHARMGTVCVFANSGAFTFGTTSFNRTDAGRKGYGIVFDSYLSWDWNTYLYPNGAYSIDVVAYDTDWNAKNVNTANVISYNPILGKGCTNAFVIDGDCDGYGVGSELGPDADDTDQDVNHSYTVLQTYTTVANFLSTVKSYTCDAYIVVDPVNGTAAGTRSATHATAEADPYLTFDNYSGVLQAGDCIIHRGTPDTSTSAISNSTINGASDNQIYFLAYPGEQWNYQYNGSSGYMFVLSNISYWTIDGMGGGIVLDPLNRANNGLSFGESDHITVKEIEVKNCARASYSANGMSDIAVYRSSFHDATMEHIVYWGGTGSGTAPAPSVNDNITFSEMLVYGSTNHGLKFNRGVTDLLIEKSIFHGTGNSNIAPDMGGTNITITNNVAFNGNRFFHYDNYGGVEEYTCPIDDFGPWTLTNLLIQNNTIYRGLYDETGTSESGGATITFTSDADVGLGTVAAWANNTAYTAMTDCATEYSQVAHWVIPTTGVTNCMYACITGGTSASLLANEPVWPTTSNQTVNDNGVVWKAHCLPKISNAIIRNNIIYSVGWAAGDTILRVVWYDAPAAWDWFLESADTPVIKYNILYSGTNRVMSIKDVTYQTLTQMEADRTNDPSSNWASNISSDPLFTSTNSDWYDDPWKYSLTTSILSPAKDGGSSTGIPSDDIKGVTRVGYDIGAYEIGSGVASTTGCTIQGGSFK